MNIWKGKRYKVEPLGETNLFSDSREFNKLNDALNWQASIKKEGVFSRVIVNQAVLDKKGEFIGWKPIEV